MQAFSAYYENGKIIPFGNPTIPEGRKIIVTVLDEPEEGSTEGLIERRLKALDKLQAEIHACNEPLDIGIEDIPRPNIIRAVDL